jgi:hypothetical protein
MIWIGFSQFTRDLGLHSINLPKWNIFIHNPWKPAKAKKDYLSTVASSRNEKEMLLSQDVIVYADDVKINMYSTVL